MLKKPLMRLLHGLAILSLATSTLAADTRPDWVRHRICDAGLVAPVPAPFAESGDTASSLSPCSRKEVG